MFGFRKRRNPLEDFDISIGELVGLIEEGVEWCNRPVSNADDAPLALDYIARAKAVVEEAERLGLYRSYRL